MKGRILEEQKNFGDALILYKMASKLQPEDESIVKRLRRLEDLFCQDQTRKCTQDSSMIAISSV